MRELFGKSEFIPFQVITRRLKIQDWKTAIEDRQSSHRMDVDAIEAHEGSSYLEGAERASVRT